MDTTQGKTACITGATSGIGAAFASRFASQGYDLILTGRRREKIEMLADNLSAEYGVVVDVVIAELSDDRQFDSLAEQVRATESVEVLVNNAGFSTVKPFHEEDFSSSEAMLKVHNLATIQLCYAALPNMLRQRRGSIINVSSLAALAASPKIAVYSASKAFVKLFTESIHFELEGTGVKVQALCPGMTRTDFHERIGFDKDTYYKTKGLMKAMTPEQVVDISLRYLEKDKVVCVPGRNNKLLRLLLKILPEAMIYRITSSMMRRKAI